MIISIFELKSTPGLNLQVEVETVNDIQLYLQKNSCGLDIEGFSGGCIDFSLATLIGIKFGLLSISEYSELWCRTKHIPEMVILARYPNLKLIL